MQWKNKIVGYGEDAPENLLANPQNYRLHPKYQQDVLKEQIEKGGIIAPVIVNKRTGFMIDGHLRVTLAIRENQNTIPIAYVDLSEEDEKLMLATYDAITYLATIEEDTRNTLAQEVEEQKENLEKLLDEMRFDPPAEDNEGEDDVPEVEETAISVLGDVWILGNHRLMCGDSTSIDAVEKLMDGQKADMVFTDPPYNVNFKGQELSNTTKNGKKILHHEGANTNHDNIKNDCMDDNLFIEFITLSLNNLSKVNKGAWYFCFVDLKLDLILVPLKETGFSWKSIIIWKKNQATLSGKDYKSRYEPIVYGCPSNCFFGERYKQEDIWEFTRTLKNDLHPTMKPIPLIENAINNSSKEEMNVIDVFGGSGSTLIACEKTKRNCYMMELDPKYIDVIIKRWQDFTGKQATLENTDKTFKDIETERL